MITILKEGKKSQPRRYFKCYVCGCEFIAEFDDTSHDRDGYHLNCPTCYKYINWETGKTESEVLDN